ncbi:hypothetical protein GPJ56_009488 [Histomonas meleagridis]|uniref:uncharacterized protein n=1 Tax=Histomonas meleagridis TaxID=135588 RepID=UPI00355A0241|nr:hypothetical protein GPJ56_009488 [Histomonas meleagridis]KAH0804629.1 hypothetical protein GO595_002565 [Histomonas meleagridis]
MSTLFDDNEPVSFFAARKKVELTKQQQPPPPRHTKKHQKTIQIIYKCVVFMHSLDQNTKETTELGEFDLRATKNKDNISIIAVNSETNKQLTSIPINREIYWEYCNDNKCITNAPQVGAIVIEFPNLLDSKIFTVIALHIKARQYGGLVPIKILGNDDETTRPIDIFTIDLSKTPAVVSDLKVNFMPPQNTTQSEFSSTKGPGSTAVILISEFVFGFIEVKSIESPPEDDIQTEEIVEEHIEEEETSDFDQIEQTVAAIKSEADQRFDEIALMLHSIRPRSINFGKITVSNDKLLYEIQCAINAIEDKEEKLRNLQITINKFDDALTEKEEKFEINHLQQKIKEEITNEENNIKKIDSEYETNLELIKELQQQKKQQEEMLINAEKKLIEEDKKRATKYKENLEKKINENKQKIEKIKLEKEEIEKKLFMMTKENKFLQKENNQQNNEQELEKLQIEIKEKLKQIVKQIAIGSLRIVNNNINKDGKFSGKMTKVAVQKALAIAANAVLGDDDEEEEEENEEEEEKHM